jgi:hypothetical protein
MDKNTLIIGGIVVVGLFFLMNQNRPMQQGFGFGGQQGAAPNVAPGATNQTASDFEQWFGAAARSVQQGVAAYQSVRNAIQNPTGTPAART